jgi:hypothetical protein
MFQISGTTLQNTVYVHKYICVRVCTEDKVQFQVRQDDDRGNKCPSKTICLDRNPVTLLIILTVHGN